MAPGSTGRTVGRAAQHAAGGYPVGEAMPDHPSGPLPSAHISGPMPAVPHTGPVPAVPRTEQPRAAQRYPEHPNETSGVWRRGEPPGTPAPDLPPWLGDSRPLPVVPARHNTGEIPRVPAAAAEQRPPAGGRRRRSRPPRMPLSPRRRRLRLIRRAILVLFAVFVLLVGASVTKALLAPGTSSVEARLAEWGRNHHLGRTVTWLENYEYKRHPPKVGGELSTDDIQQLKPPVAPPPVREPELKPIQPFLADPLPHEGEWTPTVVVNGLPVIQVSKLRSDPEHTAYLSAVAWVNQKRSRFVLHPGSQEPGGTGWGQADHLAQADRPGLIASWNGGFRLTNGDAKGGFYLNGKSYGQLRTGQASEVLLKDGSLRIGEWGRDFQMAPDVVGVRQNLSLLVDNGIVNPSVDSSDTTLWGLTVDNAFFVWRSGVGITADGNIVYAMGPALSVHTLAELLRRAGAVRAMELDINAEWVSFMSYTAGPDPFGPVATKLLPEFKRNPGRYFTTDERDFIAVYLRPQKSLTAPVPSSHPHVPPPPPPALLPPPSQVEPVPLLPPPIR